MTKKREPGEWWVERRQGGFFTDEDGCPHHSAVWFAVQGPHYGGLWLQQEIEVNERWQAEAIVAAGNARRDKKRRKR